MIGHEKMIWHREHSIILSTKDTLLTLPYLTVKTKQDSWKNVLWQNGLETIGIYLL